MKPLKGAAIGYGFIFSEGHLPAYLRRDNEFQIVAVADICEARRHVAQERLPDARIYTDYEILFEQEAQELDFVDIATPPRYHAEIAKAALSRGFHVLCEKPLTTTLDEAKSVLATARENKKVILPCHNYKHAPVVKAIREVIENGRIGKVRLLTLNTFRNTHAKGVAEWHPDWRRENRYSGGGIAMDHGSHTFYLTFDWLGNYPTQVTAKMDNLESTKYDTEDNFSASLTFPTGLAQVNLTWTAGVRKVIYTVQGTQGAITVDDDEMQIAIQAKTEASAKWETERNQISSNWMDASHVHWFSSLLDQFQKSIEKNEFVGKDAEDALHCMATIEGAYRSAKDHSRLISLDAAHS